MPIFRVTVEEEHEDTFEEIYHAWRTMYCTRVVEVEAEDEDEAEALASDGEGTLIEEDWDYGDVSGSEFYESGESIDQNFIDCTYTVETLSEYSERARAAREQYRQALESMRQDHREFLRKREQARLGPPAWEV